MYNTFNMGTGLVIAVDATKADEAVRILQQAGAGCNHWPDQVRRERRGAGMKRIVVLVSGGAPICRLCWTPKTGEIPGGQITCVIASKPGVYALERAAAHGIPGKVLERKAYPDAHAYSAAMRDLLLAEQADLVVYAGFLTILDEQVVDAFPAK